MKHLVKGVRLVLPEIMTDHHILLVLLDHIVHIIEYFVQWVLIVPNEKSGAPIQWYDDGFEAKKMWMYEPIRLFITSTPSSSKQTFCMLFTLRNSFSVPPVQSRRMSTLSSSRSRNIRLFNSFTSGIMRRRCCSMSRTTTVSGL